MATIPDINSDLDPNAVPTEEEFQSTYGDVVEDIPLIPSAFSDEEPLDEDVAELTSDVDTSLFSNDEETLFYNEPAFVPTAVNRPIATSMIAIATSELYSHPAIIMQEQNLQKARDILDTQKEFSTRLTIAQERQKGLLLELERYKQNIVNARQEGAFSQEAANAIDTTYSKAVQERVEDNAATALEFEVVERIQDSLANNDPIQAKVIWDLYGTGQRGTSQKIIHDEAVKNLIAAQRLEELQGEADDEGWVSYLTNFVLSMVPTAGNWDASGIMDDAGIQNQATSFSNWFKSGTGLERQSEVLWDLSPADFAIAMDRNGPVIQAIKDNAGFLRDSPAAALHLLQSLNYQTESDRAWANAWGIADPALILPWSKVGKVPSVLTRLGARKQAVEAAANAYDQIIAKGAKDTAEKTGIKEFDVIEEIEIKPANPTEFEVSRSVDISAHIAAAKQVLEQMPKTLAGSRFTSADELANAFDASTKGLEREFGKSLKDTQRVVQNVSDDSLSLFKGTLDEEGDIVGLVVGTFGKKEGGGFAREATARGAASRAGFDPEAVEVFKDVSGQYWYKAKFNVADEGFITSDFDTPAGSLINNIGVRSTARTADASLQAKALSAGNQHIRIQNSITKILRDSLKGVSRKDKKNLDQVIRKGQNEAKWFTPQEFIDEYARHTGGRIPPQRTIDAYKTYVVMNDLDYMWRNNALYMQRARKGAESVKFTLGKTGMDIDTDAVIKTSKPTKTTQEIFDATNGEWIRNASPDEIGKFIDDGFVRLDLQDTVTFPDGMATNSILIKKSDMNRSPLRRNVLAYSEGGHRAYAGKYFVKQGRTDVLGRYLNPNTFITGNNRNLLGDWAEKMNRAIDDFNEGITDAAHFDDEIFQGAKGFPSGEEFLDDIQMGRISKDNKIEVVYDRELPSEYANIGKDVLNFVDETETPVAAHARTTGRMYYSRKGEHLTDYYGELAETLDPWETLNTALSNVARLSSYSGYKTNALERFKATYGAHLNLKNADSVTNLYELVEAKVKQNLPVELQRKIHQEQQSMRLILNHETGIEKNIRRQTRIIAEKALGDSINDKGMRQALHNGVYYLEKNNPVAALRGIAFDAKLGLFNFGQFFIQTSTALAAAALNPKYGFKGMAMAYPMMSLANMPRGLADKALDTLAKRGVWKLGGFADEAEFRDFGRYLADTGIMTVGNTQAQLNLVGPNRVFGATSKLDAVREAGRVMFYAAEQVNRATAARIAWGELSEQGVKRGTNEFKERFVQLVDDYSLNMMGDSKAAFQSGAMSIPTQFWSYSFRMMDAMLGKRFTPEQKARLWISQAALTGVAGIPLGEQVASFLRESNGGSTASFEGETFEERSIATLERGMIDRGLWEIFQADVRAGEKVGTAGLMANVIADLFGKGQFGEKSTAEMMVGATGSITMSAFETLGKIIKYQIAESGGEFEGNELTRDAALELAKEVALIGNVSKAILVNQYGIYKSKRGTIQAEGIPSEASFFIAMGLQPQEVQELSNLFDYFEDKTETIKDFSTVIRNYRQEAFTNPDKYEVNMKKVSAFTQMIPEDIRQEVLERSNKIQDKSLYDAMAKKWEKEMLDRNLREALGELEEREENDNGN